MAITFPRVHSAHIPTHRWAIPASVTLAVALNTAAAVIGAQAEQARTPTLVDPANYAFSVWFVIFAGNVAFAVYQALPSQRANAVLDRAAWPFVVGQLFGAAFAIATLLDSVPVAQITTIGYFVASVATYLALRVGIEPARWPTRILVWAPASLSMGWLLAATIVTIAGFLQNDLELASPYVDAKAWAAAAIGFAALSAVFLLLRLRDVAFAAIVAWALVGIAVAQGNEVVDRAVAAAVGAIALVALLTLVRLVRR